jgi:hypothetical protein
MKIEVKLKAFIFYGKRQVSKKRLCISNTVLPSIIFDSYPKPLLDVVWSPEAFTI